MPQSRFLALGDSYTIGEGVPAEQCWPRQLVAHLRANGIDISEPQIIATTGWTTDELDAAIYVAQPQGPFDLVSLSVGVNNQYRGRPLDEFAAQFEALLKRAIGFAGQRPERVLVLSIPDWGVTPFGAASGRDVGAIANALDTFNAAKQQVCARHGVAFVDVSDVSRQHGATAVVGDGLHPDGSLYGQWVELALPVAEAALRD